MSENILVRVGADITDFSRGMSEANRSLRDFGDANRETFDAFKKVGAGVLAGGAAIATGLGATVKVASDFQSAFAGVRKTVDTSEEGFAVLEQGIRNMAKELPATASEIAGVAESAGQLGIAEGNILSFSRTMIDLGEATNMTADEAATSFARFANITQMPQTEFDKLGSVVVDLGNNMATTEGEIVAMSMRLAAQGKQVGMTESDIMALAGTMSSLGIEAEAGGTAMTTVLTKMQKAVGDGGAELENFAKAAGTSSKEFAESFKNDPVKALEMLASGLGESAEAGGNMSSILEDLGIKGIREADVMKRLAGNSELLGEAVDIANGAWTDNSALTDEATQRYETFESKLSILKNTVTDFAITIGNVLLPFVTSLVDNLSRIDGWISNMNPKIIQAGVVITALAGAAMLVAGPLLILIGFIPQIVAGFGMVMTVVKGSGAAFAALTGPIGLTIAAIAGIIAVAVLAYNKVDWFHEMVDNAWTKIKAGTVTAFNAIKQVITQVISNVVTFGKSQLDMFKAFWQENGADINATVKSAFNQIKGNIEMVMGVIKGIFQIAWPIISGVVKTAWALIQSIVSTTIHLVLGIIQTVMKLLQGDWKGAWETIKSTAKTIMDNIVAYFKAIDLLQVGKDIIRGLVNGIGSMIGAVKTKVSEIANAIPDGIKSLLGIKSPSRVTTELGEFVSMGLANGIASKKGDVEKAITDLGLTIKDVTEHYASETVKIVNKSREEIAKIEKRSSQDIAKIHSTAKAKKRKLTKQESIKIQRIEEDSAKKISDIQSKAAKDSVKLLIDADKDKLKEIKLFIEDKKSLDQLSLADEARIWKESAKLFSDGTKEKVEAQAAYRKAVEALNKEIEAINKEHIERISNINEELAKGEQKLTDEYNKAYSDRVSAILNFAGIFDQFVSKFEGSGRTLLSNLQSQVTGLEEWREVLSSLWGKIDDQALMEELEALGPKAVGELKALNGLSDAELAKYVELYNQKFTLAREQANVELAGLKEDTQTQITALREVANAELDIVHKEWQAKIVGLTKATDDQLKTLKQVGRNAGQGLLDGLASMEPALLAKARAIANAIKATISSALDIRSPSRWMRDHIGVNMMLGWIEGMKSMRTDVLAMTAKSAEWMKPAEPRIEPYRTPNMSAGLSRGVSDIGGMNSSTGGFNPQITNYFTPAQSTPYESSRRQTQELRRAALEMGFR